MQARPSRYVIARLGRYQRVTFNIMSLSVNLSDVVPLLSRRIADLIVDLDTHRVLAHNLQEVNEALTCKVVSLSNLINSLESQVVTLGAIPVTRGVVVPEVAGDAD